MEGNLRRYPAYVAARGLLFWLPVFFLYFEGALGLAEALWLEAVYYTAFVLLEVPSGYASDAWGRRPTLLAGALFSALGAVVFAFGEGFGAWSVGQLLFAAGFAFDSGTDQSLLYDSLAAEGREAEFRAAESRAASASLGAVALASLLGGALGAVDLRLPYVATAIAAIAALLLALGFAEPPRVRASSPDVQLSRVRTALAGPVLRWTTLAAIAGTVLNHVPYEFLQPWLAVLLGAVERTALASGALAFLIVGIGALAARRADALATRWGAVPTILGMLALQAAIIAAMGAVVAWWLVPLVLARAVPGAVLRPVLGGVQHPLLTAGIRATTLSVQSLAGRLAFGLSLLLAGRLASGGIAVPLAAYAGLGAVVVAALFATRPREP